MYTSNLSLSPRLHNNNRKHFKCIQPTSSISTWLQRDFNMSTRRLETKQSRNNQKGGIIKMSHKEARRKQSKTRTI